MKPCPEGLVLVHFVAERKLPKDKRYPEDQVPIHFAAEQKQGGKEREQNQRAGRTDLDPTSCAEERMQLQLDLLRKKNDS
ncbi:hypothetical protein TNCT_670661 [Trichonephila clavata]|uniref:Uncharacterized protein n=1 Tax=Trichonephila clavata TaxID=2740835 RepID=A0A8X6M124_TRICU|nr:hypothetical protein TNCT_670661 [Trichonephila clavata]